MPRCPYPIGGVRSSLPSPWFFEPVTTGVMYVYLKAIKILRIKKNIQYTHIYKHIYMYIYIYIHVSSKHVQTMIFKNFGAILIIGVQHTTLFIDEKNSS